MKTGMPKMSALVVNAIKNLQESRGSTRKEILHYILSKNKASEPAIQRQMLAALKRAIDCGLLKYSRGKYMLTDALKSGDDPYDAALEKCGPSYRRSRRRRSKHRRSGKRRSYRARSRRRGKKRRSRRSRSRRRSRKSRHRQRERRRGRRMRRRSLSKDIDLLSAINDAMLQENDHDPAPSNTQEIRARSKSRSKRAKSRTKSRSPTKSRSGVKSRERLSIDRPID